MSDSTYQVIDYSFLTLKQAILDKLKTKSEWTNISENDPVLQMFLYILATDSSFKFASFNKLFLDAFPTQSMAEEYLYRFVNFIGMSIDRAISADGIVTFTIPTTYAKQIIIPAETEVSTADGSVIFSALETKYINPGSLTVDVEFIQGQYKTQNYIGTGENFQRYFIYDTVENTNITVTINDVLWTKVDNFFFSHDTDNHYKIVNVKDGIYVLFSDGVFGKKPALDDTIVVKYIQTLGDAGNILQTDILTTLVSAIYDVDGTQITNITVTNDAVIQDGSDADTLSDIRANITRFFTTNPYITRRDDYRDWLLLNDLVRDVNVYAGWELGSDSTTYTTVFLYVVPKVGTVLTTEEKEELFDYVKEKDIFFVNLTFEDCTYISVNNACTVKLKDASASATKITEISNQITDIIEDYYDFELAMTDYGTVFRNIYLSEIIDRIMAITDIRKINIVLSSVEQIDIVESGDTVFNKILSYEDLKSTETYLYVETEKVGTYNASWVLVPQDNSATGGHNWIGKVSSTINNITKSVNINILDPDLTNTAETGNVVGDYFYVWTNALNDFDLLQSSENMVFDFWDKSITFE